MLETFFPFPFACERRHRADTVNAFLHRRGERGVFFADTVEKARKLFLKGDRGEQGGKSAHQGQKEQRIIDLAQKHRADDDIEDVVEHELHVLGVKAAHAARVACGDQNKIARGVTRKQRRACAVHLIQGVEPHCLFTLQSEVMR